MVVPSTSSVTVGLVPAQLLGAETQLACGATFARTELWLVVAPPSGIIDIAVSFGANARVVHSSAALVSNVDQAMPVRAVASGFGMGTAPAVDVLSEAGDLVLDALGGGCSTGNPTTGQTLVTQDNFNCNYDLGNAASSSVIASGSTTTMAWTAPAMDHWQMVAVSLTPAM